MSEGPRAGALLLGLLLAGCKGRPLVVGSGAGAVALSGANDVRSSESGCFDLVASRALDSECWPTRHVGRWHGFVTGDAQYLHVLATPFVYPSDDLLLEIDAQGSAFVTFSGGDAGVAEAGAPCSNSTADLCGATPGLVLGFRYELVGLRMSGGPNEDRRQDPRMDFSLVIAEPWSALCDVVAADAGPCSCTAEGCGASTEALQVSLVLSADGRALRGSARSEHLSEALSASWEFVRE